MASAAGRGPGGYAGTLHNDQGPGRTKQDEDRFHFHSLKPVVSLEAKEKYVAELRLCRAKEFLFGVTLDGKEPSVYRRVEMYDKPPESWPPPAPSDMDMLIQLGSTLEKAGKHLIFDEDDLEWKLTVSKGYADSDNDRFDEEESNERAVRSGTDWRLPRSNINIAHQLIALFTSQMSSGIGKQIFTSMLVKVAAAVNSNLEFFYSGSNKATDPLARPVRIMKDPSEQKRRTSSVPITSRASRNIQRYFQSISELRTRKREHDSSASSVSSISSDSSLGSTGHASNPITHMVADIMGIEVIFDPTEHHMHTCLIVEIKRFAKDGPLRTKLSDMNQLFKEAVPYLNNQDKVYGLLMKTCDAKLYCFTKTADEIKANLVGAYNFQQNDGSSFDHENFKRLIYDIASVFSQFGNLYPKACQICRPPQQP